MSDCKAAIISIAIIVATGVMVIFATGYSVNVAVATGSIKASAANAQFVSGQSFGAIDMATIPDALPADHYLDRDLNVWDKPVGCEPPSEMVLLDEEQYKIAQDLHLPNYVPEHTRQRLIGQLEAIYESGGFGRANVVRYEELRNRAN